MSKLDEFLKREGIEGFQELKIPESKIALITLVDDAKELQNKPELTRKEIVTAIANSKIYDGIFARDCTLYVAVIPR